jgi:hypothetical protein
MSAVVFAHQGGWDEILFALVPLVVVGLLLRLANTRAKALQAQRAAAEANGDTTDVTDATDAPADPPA